MEQYHLWPVALKPQDDELLSSWLVRLARAHGLNLHTFCQLSWPNKQIWTRDIDRIYDEEIFSTLCFKTGSSPEIASNTSLRYYWGRVYEDHLIVGPTFWIRPIGIYHRIRMKPGLQYCPLCLKEGPIYFRKNWRLGFVAVCIKHGVILYERCPFCASPMNFHRSPGYDDGILLCHDCHKNILAYKFLYTKSSLDVLELTEKLIGAAHTGWYCDASLSPMHSILFFKVLRLWFKILGVTVSGIKLTRAVAGDEAGYMLRPSGRIARAEDLEPLVRYQILVVVSKLLEDWPNEFLFYLKKAGMRYSDMVRDMRSIPYWYWSVLYWNLYQSGRSKK